ncbi:hypothetical protein C5167_009554 [Papaver somniferum]|uniref:Uncharacterized protein n=1 Tax=Papaver somniferum TaxID=3469 RepID=A0A4Y7K0T3_PAPSO|nr:hypothetical protein C5167_009554 [Papaver somniferum]
MTRNRPYTPHLHRRLKEFGVRIKENHWTFLPWGKNLFVKKVIGVQRDLIDAYCVVECGPGNETFVASLEDPTTSANLHQQGSLSLVFGFGSLYCFVHGQHVRKEEVDGRGMLMKSGSMFG